MKTLKLIIELVPSTVWYSSIYRLCKEKNQMHKWHKIKKELFEKEGRKCWICGKENIRLEAHEFWEYDDLKHIQKLGAIHHLCSMCHKIKHIGLWLHTEDGARMLKEAGLSEVDVIAHFCAINNCSVEDFDKHKKEAFEIFAERSKYNWKQDFGNIIM